MQYVCSRVSNYIYDYLHAQFHSRPTSRLLGVVNKSKDLYYTKCKVQYINEKRSPFSVLSCCCYNNNIRKKAVMGREWKSKWVRTTNVFRLFYQFSLFLFHYIQTAFHTILYLKCYIISQTVASYALVVQIGY